MDGKPSESIHVHVAKSVVQPHCMNKEHAQALGLIPSTPGRVITEHICSQAHALTAFSMYLATKGLLFVNVPLAKSRLGDLDVLPTLLLPLDFPPDCFPRLCFAFLPPF